MINRKSHHRIGSLAKALCALSLAAACAPAWSGDEEPNYEMAVFLDAAQGPKILTGNYAQAIEKIRSKDHAGDTLRVKTNLCVAFTKSGDIEAAEQACDEAVAEAKSFRKVRRSTYYVQTAADVRARYLAIALSNRGVLKAVKGDFEAAREDFDAAMAQRAWGISTARANLEKLEQMIEESA